MSPLRTVKCTAPLSGRARGQEGTSFTAVVFQGAGGGRPRACSPSPVWSHQWNEPTRGVMGRGQAWVGAAVAAKREREDGRGEACQPSARTAASTAVVSPQ